MARSTALGSDLALDLPSSERAFAGPGPSLVPDVSASQIAECGDWQLPQCDPKWEIFVSSKGASDMVPVAYIEHQLPGRVRLRVPSRRGDVPFFEKIVRELSKHPATRELTAAPLTGSITLHYCEPLQPITAAAADQKLFETGRLEPQTDGSQSKQVSGLREGSGLAGGIAAGLSGLGVFQVVQGNVLGSAVENLWHAFGAQRIFGRPDIAVVFAALGIYQLLSGQIFGAASSLFFYALVLPHIAAMEQARSRSWASAAARTAKDASSANDSEAETAARAAGSLLDKAVEK